MPEKSAIRRRIVPSVPFTLSGEDEGGKFELSFRLAFDLNAFTEFEEVTGLNALSNMHAVWDAPTVGTITALFWAALLKNHAEDYAGPQGLREVRSLLTFADCKPAFKACIEAFISQLPPEKAAEIRKRQKDIAEGKPVDVPLAEGPTTTA
jgi:hypothetical protein